MMLEEFAINVLDAVAAAGGRYAKGTIGFEFESDCRPVEDGYSCGSGVADGGMGLSMNIYINGQFYMNWNLNGYQNKYDFYNALVGKIGDCRGKGEDFCKPADKRRQ